MEVKLVPRHISTEKEKEIVEYYKSKPMTFNELVSKFGLCSPSIGKILNFHGIKGEVRILSDFEFKDKVFVPNMKIYVGRKKEEDI